MFYYIVILPAMFMLTMILGVLTYVVVDAFLTTWSLHKDQHINRARTESIENAVSFLEDGDTK